MAARNAGSAFIKIRPDATAFVRDLQRDLAAAKDPGFVVDVAANTSQATADIKRFRDVHSREGVRLGVDMALGQAEADLKAFRARQAANGMTIKVDADTGKARSEIAGMRRQLDSFSRTDLRINLGAAGLTMIPIATNGLVQLAGALQQVAQAGFAVPGGIAAATASIGTLAFGLSGVMDAYEAVSAASDSAGKDQAASARAATQASNQLRNAVVDEAQARKDVAQATRDARQELQDLNVEMRGGLISESRAILEAQQARERLASGQFTDVRDALLSVQEADQRVLEVQTRNSARAEKLRETNAKGVANSDQVVAANERHARSLQQLGDAQAVAADAASSSSAAQEKAADAMGKLSPKAQDFVDTLVGLKGPVADLKKSVQEVGFDGLAGRFDNAVRTLLPTLEDGLGGIARGWNANFEQLFTSIGSTNGRGIIDRILGNTGDAQQRFTKAIDPIITGLGTLTAAGTDAMPRVADAIGDVAQRFSNFITQADQDGRLQQWIDEGLTGIGNLGETILSLGKSWTAITKAAGGKTLLADLERLTGQLQTFLNSADGQEKLKAFFDEGRAMLDQWRPILEAIPGLFEGIYDGAKTYIGGVLTVIGPLVEFLSDHPTLVATAIAAWAGFKTIGPIVGGVKSTLQLFAGAVTQVGTGFYPMRDDAKKAMAGVDDTFKKAGQQGSGMNKFATGVTALSAAGGPMALLVTAGIPLIATFANKLSEKMQEAAEKTDFLNQRQLALLDTLDKVTGKLTDQSLESQINAAQNYNPGGAGGGIPGISQGDALAAAVSLGISPDLYGKALINDPAAKQQVLDILTKNNLLPEFAANPELQKTSSEIGNLTDGKITQQDLINALLNAPGAVDKYNAALREGAYGVPGTDEQTAQQTINSFNLADIAKRLAPTGQASVLAGGAMTTLTQTLPQGGPTRQANQAVEGRYRIKAGAGGPFGESAQVDASDTDAKVTVPGEMAAQLQQQNIPFITNLDGTLTATVPLNSPYIEKYEKGGMVPGRGPKVAIVHGGELVVPERTVRSLKKFDEGGPNDDIIVPDLLPAAGPGSTDPGLTNPAAPGGTVSAPATLPIAPNPTAPGSGGVSGIFSQVLSGIQGPIGNAIAIGQQIGGMVGQTPAAAAGAGGAATGGVSGVGGSLGAVASPDAFAARAAGMPGIAGLFGSMAIQNPDMQKAALTAWGSQTAQYVGNWGLDTATQVGSALWDAGGRGGILGFFGLENSILSSSNPYHQAAAQTGDFFMNSDGPLGKLMGVSSGKSGTGGAAGTSTAGLVDPGALAAGYGTVLDDNALATLYGQTGDKSLLANLTPGAQRAVMYAQQHAVGQKYVYGAAGPDSFDCSGIASGIYNAATGQSVRFNTESDFAALGFLPGNMPGALNIGVQRGGGGPNSHMAVTLPNGVAVESGGSHGTTSYGGEARGAGTFPLQWYLPLPPQFEKGGPTPSGFGPVDAKGGHLAIVHPKEFMISARGRATVPDEFLHDLNQGRVDPKDLPGYYPGGPIATAGVRPQPVPPPPRVQARQMNPTARPVAPSRPAPTPTRTPSPAAAAPSMPAMAAPSTPAAPTPATPAATGGSPAIVAPNQGAGGINHNVDWMNTLIRSSASNLGQLAATAMSIASMGGAGIPGMGAIGAAGPFVAGGIQQGGKVVEGLVNVVSSALVGNVPGSFGGPAGASPYGKVIGPQDSDAPMGVQLSGRGGGGGRNYTFNGISDINRLMDRLELNDKMETQATLAKHS